MASTSRKRIRLDPSASPPTHGSDSDTERAFGRVEDQRRKPPKGEDVQMQDLEAMSHQNDDGGFDIEEAQGEEHCVICLQAIQDRTILPCAHDRLCFNCILLWCEQSRKCPLCNAHVGDYLIHNFRSKYDYSKYYLPPLASSPPPAGILVQIPPQRTRGRDNRWGRRRERLSSQEREDALEVAISRRRWVYRHELYAKHVASNPYTRYRPCPTPAQISASPDLISRATIFIRRELRVWINLDVEFLTTFILSLMKSLDLRSESAIKLLAEFLDMDTPYFVGNPNEPSRQRFSNAEHFSHELYAYLRSPFRDLSAYDAAVQYDVPVDVPPTPTHHRIGQHRQENRKPSSGMSGHARQRSPSSSHRSPSRKGHSPSPIRSHDYEDLYRPRERSRGFRGGRHEKDYLSSTNNRAKKGKRQIAPRSEFDTRQPREGGNQYRANEHDNNLSSSYHDETPSRHHMERGRIPAPRLPHQNHPPSSTSSENGDRHNRNNSGRSAESRSTNHTQNNHSKQSLISPHATPESRGSPGAIISAVDSLTEPIRQIRSVSKPSDQNTDAVNPVVGILIKGQAKLLVREPEHGISVSDSDGMKDGRKGGTNGGGESFTTNDNIGDGGVLARHRSAAELLHAHFKGSTRLERNSGRDSDTATAAAASSSFNNENERVTVDQRPSSTLASGCDAPSGDSMSSGQPQVSQVGPAPADVGLQRHGIPSREIMLRTRAKLAKLRAQSLMDVAPGATSNTTFISSATTNVNEPTSSTRARLLQRLEEEKRLVNSPIAFGESENRLLSENLVDDTATGTDTFMISKREPRQDEKGPHSAKEAIGQGNAASSDLETMEKRLRAQALLRVRLSAEKKKAGDN